MRNRRLLAAAVLLVLTAGTLLGEYRITEDKDLTEIDLSKWDCLDQPGGTAKSEDGVARNRGKNRPFQDVSRLRVPDLNTASFLKLVGPLDAQTKESRRKDLTGPQTAQLAALEKQIVSLTGYLVLAYAGPPESTNCGSVDFHDWHLEVFEKPADHPPRPGDPTPIICEITPRTQNQLYRAGIRLEELAGFMRPPGSEPVATGKPARKIRLTGYLLWDDDHNGSADVGPRITSVGKNHYNHPWRSTAWEIHPLLKIEVLEGAPPKPMGAAAEATPEAGAPPEPVVDEPPAPPPAPAAPTPTPTQSVTLLEPLRIKIPYGETVLPRGLKLQVISRDAQSVTVDYLGQTLKIPLQNTDLR